jgi:hypothetical protein
MDNVTRQVKQQVCRHFARKEHILEPRITILYTSGSQSVLRGTQEIRDHPTEVRGNTVMATVTFTWFFN